MAKPTQPLNLPKGHWLGEKPGFIDHFNWMDRSLFNLKGGKGIDLDWQDGEHPVINATSTGGGSVTQFEGTDGTTTTEELSGTVKFASAADSNVVVTCSADTITIGVYYI